MIEPGQWQVGVGGISTTGIGDQDVLKGDILDGMAGKSHDGAGEDVVEERQCWTAHFVVVIRALPRYLDCHVADENVAESAWLTVHLAETNEDGIASVRGADTIDKDIFQDTATDHFQGNR